MHLTMFFTQILHTGQIALCAYGAYVSYIAIRNLQQYEETSKKAAKYSGEAEHQLHKTRTTQASGAVCILASLVAAVTLTVAPNSLPTFVKFGISPAALVVTLFVRAHVSNFWKGKAKVPFVDGYNEAIQKTGELLQILEYLEYTWAGTALASGLVGY
ncbi:hypothetical protein D6C78_02031 [Aureobasidium pullulans]|uniref:DUF1772-domain-containing protein n=1 Tax=Aureobasidium pullulans TaxID=5580 RepID=A0A4T0C1Z4_AURPU|nr:hypothetical protein D6D10_03016 [Aureobasidium pullulans]TIA41163.1 hypothetical protein D6C78_02031 [Aureobasidium pullulans]